MKTRFWTALLAAAALCLVVAVPAAAKDPVRPFGGCSVGVGTGSAPTDCPAGAFGRYVEEGTGQLLHLGSIHYIVSHCVVMDSPVDGHIVPGGSVTYTAANGDTLVMTETSGSFTFDQPMPMTTTSIAEITWQVAGGTGRFAGATGSGTGAGVGNMVTGVNVMHFAGTIAY